MVKILFVDEQRLLGAMAPYHANLTGAEKALEVAKPPQVTVCCAFAPLLPFLKLFKTRGATHALRSGP